MNWFWKQSGAVALAMIVAGCAAAMAAEASGPALQPSSVTSLGLPDAPWTQHLDSSNSVAIVGDSLEFRCHARTRAHIERAFGSDLIRISCALKSDSDGTPVCLSLQWGESNFLQFGLNAPISGRLNIREVLGTYSHDYDSGVATGEGWQFITIELGRDCIRYLASRDGKTFQIVRVNPRPERFGGTPKILALGQDCDGKLFERPSPWLSPPDTSRVGTAWIKGVQIEPLSKSKVAATATERREFARRERDQAGEQELAAPGDPTFASVSRHYPMMKWSREVVGVKDHPFDIGIAPDGSLQLSENLASFKSATAHFEINGYRFGSREVSCVKALQGGWMPVVTTRDAHDGIELEQTVFGWTKDFLPDEPLFGYVQFRAGNTGTLAREIELKLVFKAATNPPAPLAWKLNVPAHGSETVWACVPFKIQESSATKITAEDFESKRGAVAAYWERLVAQGSRFEIPEARVQNAYRAWLAYNFLNVAKRKGVYEVCDGSGFYGKVYGYSAALYCNGLDLMGYPALAETYCDALLSFAHTNGLLAVNFGDTDTGTALWVMSEHYRLTRDEAWLRRVAPQVRRLCSWIVDQRHAALTNTNEPPVTRGLIRYRPYADLLHPAADYFSNGYLWKGLDATARVFAEAGWNAEAAEFRREADAYLADIRTSMKAAVFKDRGQKILPMIPDTRELWKESNGSADGYYGIIAPCLLEIGLPAPTDPERKFIIDALEQRGGLVAGVSQFHGMADHAYTYGYWLDCLQRDDVQRAILGLYGSLAYGMSRDTYAAVECTMIRTGENYWMLPHTYSNTQQLRLLRNMLVREDGDTLWLGQAIPRDWLTVGKRVAVNEAPTTFGPVSYSLEPNPDGSMRVQLSPPVRSAPKEIAIRLRDPKQRAVAGVKSVGAGKVQFSKDTVRLAHVSAPLTLEVSFR